MEHIFIFIITGAAFFFLLKRLKAALRNNACGCSGCEGCERKKKKCNSRNGGIIELK